MEQNKIQIEARPFYAIAHNTNTIQEVKDALEAGANGIEPDVNIYADDAAKLCISHLEGSTDAPPLKDFLIGLHEIAARDARLSLIIFDCKSGVANAAHGLELLTAIRDYLTFDIEINIIISVSQIEEGAIFENIKQLLGPREGLVIDENDDPESVSNYFQNEKVVNQCYGNGISIPGMPVTGPHIRPAIERACALKAAQCMPKFIYVWTVNDEELQREFIHIGVDAIFTDDMKELIRLVNEPSYQKIIRLANRTDNPFKPSNFAYSLAVYTGDKTMAGTDANITFTISGSKGAAETTINSKLPFRMERNQVNFVTLQSPDLGDLISVTVHRDNNGIAPDWWLEKIVVESCAFSASKIAVFNRDINNNSPFIETLREL